MPSQTNEREERKIKNTKAYNKVTPSAFQAL